jgi:vacuolar-type H+-ATPase subunit D/Vma8
VCPGGCFPADFPQDVREAVADLEKQREDEKRAGHSDGLLKHKVGALLAERHEVRKRLEQVERSRNLRLDSIPGYTFIAEQPETEGKKLLEKVWTREETEALQREVNVARVYRLEHPEVDVLTSLEMAHEGKITLDGASED